MTRPPDLPPYPQYKPSGIPWLDDIPAHWQVPRLKYLCSRSGIYGANVPATEYQDTGIRFLRTTDITDEGHLKDGGVFLPKELVGDYLLNDGDLLISRSGTVGRSFLYQSKLHGPCAYAGYLVRFVPGPRILPEYLFQFTQTQAFQRFLRSVVIQSTIENVNAKKYSNAHVPLPPPDEQAAIAEYLDHKDALIQRYLHAKRRLVPLLQQLRKSTIHYAVTRGLDPENTPTKPSGIPWLGDIPAHWEMRRLKYSAVNVTKMTSQRNEDEITLALENVESWSGRYADAGPDVQFDSQLKRFQVGDVLFGKLRPYLAKVALPNRPGLCVGEFLVLRPREDVLLPEYLWMLLRSPTVIDVISASSFGAKMPRTDWRFVGGMRLPLPPPDEQAAIAEYLDEKTAVIDAAIAGTSRLIDLVQQYRVSLIHHVVTGARDVRQAAATLPDTPAPIPR